MQRCTLSKRTEKITIIVVKHYFMDVSTSKYSKELMIFQALKAVLRIHSILMRIRIRVISLRFTDFFNEKLFSNFFFLAYFCLKLDEPFRNEEIFIISLFQKFKFGVLGVKKFCFAVLVDILPFGSIRGSAYFCESGSGSRKSKSCRS